MEPCQIFDSVSAPEAAMGTNSMELELKFHPEKFTLSPFHQQKESFCACIVEVVTTTESGIQTSVSGNGTIVYRNGAGYFVYTCAHLVLTEKLNHGGTHFVGMFEESVTFTFKIHHPSSTTTFSVLSYEIPDKFLDVFQRAENDKERLWVRHNGKRFVDYGEIVEFDYAILLLNEPIHLPRVLMNNNELVKAMDFHSAFEKDIAIHFYGSTSADPNNHCLYQSIGTGLARPVCDAAKWNMVKTLRGSSSAAVLPGMSGSSCLLNISSDNICVGILLAGSHAGSELLLLTSSVLSFFNEFIRHHFEEGNMRGATLPLTSYLMDQYRTDIGETFVGSKRKRLVRRTSIPSLSGITKVVMKK